MTTTEQKEDGPSFEEILEKGMKKIQEALANLPPEKLEETRKEAGKILQGDLSWADLSQYTPERLLKMAELGYNQFRIGQYDSAERIFKGMTVVDPDNYYYHQMLGATYQRKEAFPAAALEYSVAVDLNSRDVVSFTNRGEVYFKLGIYELALQDFEKAISLDAKGDDKWANRAKMLKEQIRIIQQRKK